MNKTLGTITHVEFIKPQRGETIPLKFFIKAGERYQQGLTGLRQFTKEEMENLVDEESFIPIQEKFIEEGQQVLMSETGEIYITNHAGLHTKHKTYVDQFSIPEWD